MNLLAACIFFTRLPFWRIAQVPADSFKHVVPYWPLVGWLTGGIMAATLWLAAQVLPVSLAWMAAVVVRLLLTGCLHEDGLADCCDGFGGGTTREQTLAIMKDSHIGTYGVVGLVVYFLLLTQLAQLPVSLLCVMVLCGDAWAKCCAAQLINLLPYARKEQDSKARVVYRRMTAAEWLVSLVGGWVPVLLLLPLRCWYILPVPLLVFGLLCRWMKRRLQGYTGDCCGATFLLCELSFYIAYLAINY